MARLVAIRAWRRRRLPNQQTHSVCASRKRCWRDCSPSKVLPVYPTTAQQAHVRGVVVLQAEISKDGMVESLGDQWTSPADSRSD